MKYTQYSQNKKGSSAFYITIALCLVFIGFACWVAFTNVNTPSVSPPSSKPETSKPQEYNDGNQSYISSEPEISTPSTTDPVNEEVTTEKYPTASSPKKPKSYTLPINGDILKDFNLDALQYSATYKDMRIHAAVDIACLEGTFVSACTDGKVENVEETADFGKCVTIDHGDGLIIKYCGLKNISVKKDNPVKMGDRIGSVGSIPAESSDQCHLHIEATQNGKPISILKFFD